MVQIYMQYLIKALYIILLLIRPKGIFLGYSSACNLDIQYYKPKSPYLFLFTTKLI